MTTNSKLWQRIAGVDIDSSGGEFPLSVRLSRENGWAPEKSRGAIEEYKKFLYLLCVTPSPLVPSGAVDRVWQLHLVDTYWTDFCERLLERPIRHESIDETRAYHVLDRYADTRSLYADEFECAPPAEFWPPVSERFAAAECRQALDRSGGWAVPERSGFGSILWSLAAALLAVIAGTRDLAAADRLNAVHGSSRASTLAFAGAVALAWLIGRSLRRTRKDDVGKHRRIGGVHAGRSGGGYWGCSG